MTYNSKRAFGNVVGMSDRSAGVYVSVQSDGGEVHRLGARRYVRIRVYARPGHYLSLILTDAGDWRLAEQSALAEPPRVHARGKIPSSRFTDERGWDWRR